LPDHGTRYLNKVYNDNWMKDHGFLEERTYSTARDIIQSRNGHDSLYTVKKTSTLGEAIGLMSKQGIDQVPVIEGDEFVGSVSVANLLDKTISDPKVKDKPVSDMMDKPMPFVALDSTLDVLSSLLNKNNKALLVRDANERAHIITQHDILKAMTS